MYKASGKVGGDIKGHNVTLPVVTTDLGLWINRSQEAHAIDDSIYLRRECCTVRLPVLLTGHLASLEPTDCLIHYNCPNTGDRGVHIAACPCTFLSTSCPALHLLLWLLSLASTGAELQEGQSSDTSVMHKQSFI